MINIVNRVQCSEYLHKIGEAYDINGNIKSYCLDYSIVESIIDDYLNSGNKEKWLLWKEAETTIHNYRCRRQNVRKRIEKMMSNGVCLFVTMTFAPKWFDKYSKDRLLEKSRDWVRRYLNSFNVPYVANADYGDSITHRLHYHAVIQLDYIDVHSWPYGKSLYVKKINVGKKNYEKLSTYITKLTYHATKISTVDEELPTIIYSRKS